MSSRNNSSGIVSRNLRERLQLVLRNALNVTGDLGNLQVMNASGCFLKIVCQYGFGPQFLKFFNATHEGHAACGMALLRRERVIVPDVAHDPIFAGTAAQEVMLKAGVRAVQSTPFLSRSGEPLGMLSTHYRKTFVPSTRELRKIDQLARSAARLIELEDENSAGLHVPEQPKLDYPEIMGAYSLFCRTNGCVSFVEAITGWTEAIERMENLSLILPGEFVLFRDFNVAAVGHAGIIELRNGHKSDATPESANSATATRATAHRADLR